ncbi:PAS domain-containing methyl-accepting chemotaxis protein [Uliginosibacterium sp. TH139]|uniref:methyl-accepting chemotaxis protein n=1 Tax=Uliginosibacterium sp. TH139 TaxID=2067453 RepID=UPI000C7CDDAE|nr:PAS domain-containing methyl-accepting chemotaxis protein [Uliginosibacterium sp. TH139]PLK49617.1 hypothetical protein C0V76_04080 [Uliginosibacterium sp. TH139]
MNKNQPVTRHEVKLPANAYLVSQTDLHGKITDANEAFVAISGYARDELIGSQHNIVRHPDMPRAAFAAMWADLKAGLPWRGTVKNRCKNGDHYWVDALIVPITRNRGTVGYMSVRRRPTQQQISAAEAAYAGMDAAARGAARSSSPLSLAAQCYALFALIALPLLLSLFVGALAWPAWTGSAATLLALLLLPVGALLMRQRLFSPLQRLNEAIVPMSEGDLSHRFDIARADEIGRLSNALSVMQTRWLVSIDHIREAMRTSLHNTGMANAHADAISQRIDEQYDRISAVAAATEEFCQSVVEVAGSSGEAAQAAGESREQVASGREIVAKGMSNSEAAMAAVHSARAEIGELNGAVAEIGSITHTIKEIADQTNLLALNAAIEAARAGEAGRGFAVVADEVRKLAERTTRSTAEINTMVEDIQRLTASVDMAMDQTSHVARASTETMRSSVDCLLAVQSASDRTLDLARHIAGASDQQTLAGQEITGNMEQISSLAQVSQEGLRELWQSMETMTRSSRKVDDSLKVFRLFGESTV